MASDAVQKVGLGPFASFGPVRDTCGWWVTAVGPWTKSLIGQFGVELPLHIERDAMAVLDAPGRANEILPFSWVDDILSHHTRPEGKTLLQRLGIPAAEADVNPLVVFEARPSPSIPRHTEDR